MPILNYSTTILASKTAGEIASILAKHGAEQVTTLYADREPTGISFRIGTPYGPRNFELPANAEGVHETINRQWSRGELRGGPKFRTRDHARDVAWRILKDWVEAQLAIIEAGMARLDEVMLPYLAIEPGRTLAKAYQDSAGMRAQLEAPAQ